jgi:RNA-directed DNA polymerase
MILSFSAKARKTLKTRWRLLKWVDDKGLTLHPDKTHVGNCLVVGQGFEFLGYRFEAGKRWVRKKSLKALKDKSQMRISPSMGFSL